MIAVLPIGMAQVSSANLTAQVGVRLAKGVVLMGPEETDLRGNKFKLLDNNFSFPIVRRGIALG